jgi:hypothetical protein
MEAFGPIIFVGIIALAIWSIARASRGTTTTVHTEGSIDGPGEFACEVVGESKYQDHLERIAGGRTEESARLRKRAILALEDDNPHDSNAVCVRIEGLRVGYLPRSFAKSYRQRLKEANAPTGHYWCEAIIVGGWDRGGGERGHFGVRLDLPVVD